MHEIETLHSYLYLEKSGEHNDKIAVANLKKEPQAF